MPGGVNELLRRLQQRFRNRRRVGAAGDAVLLLNPCRERDGFALGLAEHIP
jgi:hypothetical protein